MFFLSLQYTVKTCSAYVKDRDVGHTSFEGTIKRKQISCYLKKKKKKKTNKQKNTQDFSIVKLKTPKTVLSDGTEQRHSTKTKKRSSGRAFVDLHLTCTFVSLLLSRSILYLSVSVITHL